MHILIVEDESELREAIVRRLRALGHGVDGVWNGEDAEHRLMQFDYAVVVLDRMLPDGDSVPRLRRWRRRGIGVPVLLLTAMDAVPDRVEGLEAGADDYLVKPFAMDELLARVGSIARRQNAPAASLLQVGSIELDLGRREVRKSGTLIPLRPKEFALLELLASRLGRVVPRRDIIDACWDAAHEPLSNVEEALVAALRRKLGKALWIRTIRGTGYLLEAHEHGR